MAERPQYAIVGRGAWAGKMRSILESEQRKVTSIGEPRRKVGESEDGYTERLVSLLCTSGARVAWLCVPPGPHISCMMKAAIAARVHAIAEKPWLCSAAETEWLEATARRKAIRLGVHFEYSLLDEIEAWRERFAGAQGLCFGGHFAVSRPDRLGISAMINLGSHLVAMRNYAAPQCDIGELWCAYGLPDERLAWIEREGRVTDSVDFLENRQPLVQRFLHRFEAAIEGGDFPFGLDFGLRVTEDLLSYPVPQTTW